MLKAIIEDVPVINTNMANAIYRGPEGKTPIKGVDYFTESDIQEIIDLVYADINAGGGIEVELIAQNIGYNGSIDEADNVEEAIDYIHNYAIDDIHLQNVLEAANYQNAEQVAAAIPDMTLYATKTYVADEIAKVNTGGNVNLDNYYTKSEVDALIPDVSIYALKTEIPDVSAYQTAEQVEAAIIAALGAINTAEAGAY